jgi:hypothetical protein
MITKVVLTIETRLDDEEQLADLIDNMLSEPREDGLVTGHEITDFKEEDIEREPDEPPLDIYSSKWR